VGALTIRPPTKRPRDTSTQAQFTHGLPLGSANKGVVVAVGGRAIDGASLLHGPLRVDRTAETENKLNGWTDRAWTQRQGTTWCGVVSGEVTFKTIATEISPLEQFR
jgi:hypothetical protein